MLVHEKIEANIYYYVVYTSSQEKENKAKVFIYSRVKKMEQLNWSKRLRPGE